MSPWSWLRGYFYLRAIRIWNCCRHFIIFLSKEGSGQMTDNSLITQQSLCFGRQNSSSRFKEKQECAKCNLSRAQELWNHPSPKFVISAGDRSSRCRRGKPGQPVPGVHQAEKCLALGDSARRAVAEAQCWPGCYSGSGLPAAAAGRSGTGKDPQVCSRHGHRHGKDWVSGSYHVTVTFCKISNEGFFFFLNPVFLFFKPK